MSILMRLYKFKYYFRKLILKFWIRYKLRILITKIRYLIIEYHPEDLAIFLFAVGTWNSNRSSVVKLRLLYSIFLSSDQKAFRRNKRITSYSDVLELFLLISKHVPDFPQLEDFMPEGDWGEIKYYYEKVQYKILYGSDLSYSYDYIYSLELIMTSLRDQIKNNFRDDPVEQLKNVFIIQNDIIDSFSAAQVLKDDISPGHFEVCSEKFWSLAKETLPTLFQFNSFSSEFETRFITKVSRDNKGPESFIRGKDFFPTVATLFVMVDHVIIPVPPRFMMPIYLESWEDTFTKNYALLKENIQRPPMSIRIGVEFGHFARERLRQRDVFILCSATTRKGLPHEHIFPFVLVSSKEIFIFYFLSPCIDKNTIDENLSEAKIAIDQAKEALSNDLCLALHLEKKIMCLDSSGSLTPKFIVVIPHLSSRNLSFKIPANLDAEIIFGEQLLGVIDELKDVDEFEKFLGFVESERLNINSFGVGFLDLFGAFKDSNSILVDGANVPTRLFLDPHWGSRYRFESLKKFWNAYPEINFFGHPRSWYIEKETDTRLRFSGRKMLQGGYYCKIRDTHVYMNAPFDLLSGLSIRISDMLLQCLEDYFSNIPEIGKHSFFNNYKKLQVNIFSSSAIESKDELSHLKALTETLAIYNSDYGVPDIGWIGIRVVYDEEQVIRKFGDFSNSSAEVEFIQEVLHVLNRIEKDADFDRLNSLVEKLKKRKPGYTLESKEKRMSFPESFNYVDPPPSSFKMAKKTIALIAKDLNFTEGVYSESEAKSKLNGLLLQISSILDNYLEKYDCKALSEALIERLDALIFKDEVASIGHYSATKRRIKYDLDEAFSSKQESFVLMNRNLRFLIEKVTLLQPSGMMKVDKKFIDDMIGLTDWYFVFAFASDEIHHNVYPVEVSVTSDFIVETHQPDHTARLQKSYQKYLAARILSSKENETLLSPRSNDVYVDHIDAAWTKDLGFSFRDMLATLHCLSNWGYYTDIGEKTFYFMSKKAAIEILVKNITELDVLKCEKILIFLTLDAENILKIIGTSEKPTLIPTWEHYKRHSRYTIRPILIFEQSLLWGPCSTMRTSGVWYNGIITGKVPINLESKHIDFAIEHEKKMLEKSLEIQCLEIVRKFTDYAEGNLKLHKRNKSMGFPDQIGEFDVLAVFPSKNIILNLECKHLVPPYCLKDSRSLKEALFGKNHIEEKSYVGKVIKRARFLEDNSKKVLETLNWPNTAAEVTVVSVFVSKISYWWTYNPPFTSDVKYCLVDELEEALQRILNSNNGE